MRRIFVLLVVLVASCGQAVEPEVSAGLADSATPTTTAPETDPGHRVEPGVSAPCGEQFPVFVDGLDRGDPSNVHGIPGPGPDSEPAQPHQLVSHWLGDFATYELRWPPTDGSVDVTDWSTTTVDGYPAKMEPAGQERLTTVVQLSDSGGPCSHLALEVYGSSVDPLPDALAELGDAVRDGTELEAFIAAQADRFAPAVGGAEREVGRCAEPLVVELDGRGLVVDSAAVEVVERFLHDRLAGRRAEDCLTSSGLDDYQRTNGEDWPILCLHECADEVAVVGPDPLIVEVSGSGDDGLYVLAVVELSDGRRLREQLEVVAVADAAGTHEAHIAAATALSESYVEWADAEALVTTFLDGLADGDYEAAALLLVNEGYAQEVEDRLGDVYTADPVALLESFCRQALCVEPYEIVGPGATSLRGRQVVVRYPGVDRAVEVPFAVSMFEGQLTVGSLPPDR